MRPRASAVLGLAALALSASCHPTRSTVLLVTVSLAGSLPTVTGLDVTLVGPADKDEKLYPGGGPIVFPTTFTAELPARITGNVTIDVKATDTNATPLAHGRTGPFTLLVGTRQVIEVRLDCGGTACAGATVDGGVPDGGGASADAADPSCGNGRIDVGETCDTAIPRGAPGACPPPTCDDGIACTTDTRVGEGCHARCSYEEVTARVSGDTCCPAGDTPAEDADCSPTCGDGVVNVGETCDTAIAPGRPGACPSAASCDDRDACTGDFLVAAATCGAICAHLPVTTQSGAQRDGCCPAGAWHAIDADCLSECGDGQLDAPAELCDPGLPAGTRGACPAVCDDGEPCTVDVLEGSGCQTRCVSTPITALVSGDGCCPAGATERMDRDCPASCGNRVVEPGESCDKAATGSGTNVCPKTCPASPSACLKSVLLGDATVCTARCDLVPVTACGPTKDGCCPAGCTSASDADCSPTCGDGAVQPDNAERCDTGIAAGKPGACPTACSDGIACTRDVLVAAGTCQAACLYLPIGVARAGDGCCPPGADATLDADCPALCGNGVIEPPGETCDYGAGPTACPTTCPGSDACSPIRLEGAMGTCNATCVAHPVTACIGGDGCCPRGCTIAHDTDCGALCGDGVLSPGEACDRAITTGMPGACRATCDDGDACTADWASGTVTGCSRACSHATITACRGGDGCCPAGCDGKSDSDCAPTCGDGRLGAGETCDPPSTCPTSCPDDGDPCTRERLVGESTRCTAACRHEAVVACSGPKADFCCPTGCSGGADVDCPGP